MEASDFKCWLSEWFRFQASLPASLLEHEYIDNEAKSGDEEDNGSASDEDKPAAEQNDVKISVLFTNRTIFKNSLIMWTNWIVATLGNSFELHFDVECYQVFLT